MVIFRNCVNANALHCSDWIGSNSEWNSEKDFKVLFPANV